MKYEDLLQFKGVFFLGLKEPSENSLRLYFSRSKTSETPEQIIIGDKNLRDCFAIGIDEGSSIIQIDIERYIGYSILNESFTLWDEYQKFIGDAFRIYSKSRFLDFISAGTFANEDYPGPYRHYGIVCFNHIIDVASTQDPIVQIISRD